MKFRPNWYVRLLLLLGVWWRNIKHIKRDENHLRQHESYETIPCGHGIKKTYKDESGNVVRQDYTVVLADNLLPPVGSTTQY